MNERDNNGRFIKGIPSWNIGISPSDETRRKMSEADKGRIVGKETRDKHRKQMLGNTYALGSCHTEEWKRLARLRMKGNKFALGSKRTDNEKAMLLSYAIGNKVNLGRKASEETRQKLSDAHKGGNSWQWKLGFRSKPYGVDWTGTLRRKIRERDNYTCQRCGNQQEDRVFDVHHIDFDKNNNKLENLITLCCDCHRKTLHCKDRIFWIDFYGSVIRYRKVA